MKKDLVSVADLSREEILDLFRFAKDMKRKFKEGKGEKLLADKREEIAERNRQIEEGVFRATLDPRRPRSPGVPSSVSWQAYPPPAATWTNQRGSPRSARA